MYVGNGSHEKHRNSKFYSIFASRFETEKKSFVRLTETPPYFSNILYNFTQNNGQKIDGSLFSGTENTAMRCDAIQYDVMYSTKQLCMH